VFYICQFLAIRGPRRGIDGAKLVFFQPFGPQVEKLHSMPLADGLSEPGYNRWRQVSAGRGFGDLLPNDNAVERLARYVGIHRQSQDIVRKFAVAVEYRLKILPDARLCRYMFQQPNVAIHAVLTDTAITRPSWLPQPSELGGFAHASGKMSLALSSGEAS
jgi:hypothetical protein